MSTGLLSKTTSYCDDPKAGRQNSVVTGSSRGIGRAVAQRLAAEGATVVVTARSYAPTLSIRGGDGTALPGTIGETVELIEKAGGSAIGVAADLEDAQQRDSLVAEVLDRTGRIDILVNNAGFADYSVIEQMSIETFDRTLEHYLRTPFVLTRAAIPHMRKQGAGWIVNIGSVTGLAPVRPYRDYNKSSGDVVYASAKAAFAPVHPGSGRRGAGCQHRGELRGSIHGDPHPGCSATDSGRLPDRAGGVSGRNRAGDVPSSCRAADRSGGVQPALPLVATASGAHARRPRVLPPLEPPVTANPNIIPAGL